MGQIATFKDHEAIRLLHVSGYLCENPTFTFNDAYATMDAEQWREGSLNVLDKC
jgi:hypothetical protein